MLTHNQKHEIKKKCMSPYNVKYIKYIYLRHNFVHHINKKYVISIFFIFYSAFEIK
jgi:hypothetical protein